MWVYNLRYCISNKNLRHRNWIKYLLSSWWFNKRNDLRHTCWTDKWARYWWFNVIYLWNRWWLYCYFRFYNRNYSGSLNSDRINSFRVNKVLTLKYWRYNNRKYLTCCLSPICFCCRSRWNDGYNWNYRHSWYLWNSNICRFLWNCRNYWSYWSLRNCKIKSF